MKKNKTKTSDSPKYPMLAPKQKNSSVTERRVRRCLNRQTPEGDEQARTLLAAIPPEKRGAEYYFLAGCLRYRLGHIMDAKAYLDRACELSWGKIPEYETVRDSLDETSAPTPEETENFAVIDPTGEVYQPRRAYVFWGGLGECCTEACCECGCEVCTEGCCEGCASGCCEGCSCDC